MSGFTTEEIAAMAKEAGARSEHWTTRLFPAVQFLFTPDDLSRFAALAAEKAAAKERESCAQLCDALAVSRSFSCSDPTDAAAAVAYEHGAEVIRARSAA